MNETLKRVRNESQVSYDKLSDLLNLSVHEIKSKEVGEINFTLVEAVQLSNYFEIPLDKLFPEIFLVPLVQNLH